MTYLRRRQTAHKAIFLARSVLIIFNNTFHTTRIIDYNRGDLVFVILFRGAASRSSANGASTTNLSGAKDLSEITYRRVKPTYARIFGDIAHREHCPASDEGKGL